MSVDPDPNPQNGNDMMYVPIMNMGVAVRSASPAPSDVTVEADTYKKERAKNPLYFADFLINKLIQWLDFYPYLYETKSKPVYTYNTFNGNNSMDNNSNDGNENKMDDFKIDKSPNSPSSRSIIEERIYQSMVEKINDITNKRTFDSSYIQNIIQSSPIVYLRPYQFFVAWNGVITLVFDGWPEPITMLKNTIQSKYHKINKENFGSKFPKITLGCIKDNIHMDINMLNTVRNICDSFNIIMNDSLITNIDEGYNYEYIKELNKRMDSFKQTKKEWFNEDYKENGIDLIKIDALTLSYYECCSQESIVFAQKIKLNDRHTFLGKPQRLVLNMNESDNTNYLKYGNRTSHYREPNMGVSLIYKLDIIPKFIKDFTDLLPNIYDIFDPNSWHITLRTIK